MKLLEKPPHGINASGHGFTLIYFLGHFNLINLHQETYPTTHFNDKEKKTIRNLSLNHLKYVT